jgi:hypothetical protein
MAALQNGENSHEFEQNTCEGEREKGGGYIKITFYSSFYQHVLINT